VAEPGGDDMHGDASQQQGRGVDVPLWTYSQPLLGLPLAVISKYLHGFGVDADGAGPAALGRSLDALPPDDGGRARDADLAQVQVDVPPAEVEQFAATGAGVCGEAVEGE
jgi:hypothetical protein